MTSDSKYVVVRCGAMDEEILFIFSNLLTHSEFTNMLNVPRDCVLAAGFVDVYSANLFDDIGCMIPTVRAYGKSVSLGLSSRAEEDTKLAYKALGLRPVFN